MLLRFKKFPFSCPWMSAATCHSSTSLNPPKIVLGERASVFRTFTNEDVKQFARLTGDNNPIHLDAEYVNCQNVFERPVVHGALISGLVSGLIGTQLPGPGSVAVMQSCRFPSPLYVGETVRAEVVLTSIKKRFVDLAIECVDVSSPEGKKVMLGKITVMLSKSRD